MKMKDHQELITDRSEEITAWLDTSLENLSDCAARLGKNKGNGSHYCHLVLAWRIIKIHGHSEEAYSEFLDLLYGGKRKNDTTKTMNAMQNHLWFGIMLLCMSRHSGKQDNFFDFLRSNPGLLEKKLFSNIGILCTK